jgi:hypothetical protein
MPDTCTWRSLDIDPAELALNAERRETLSAVRELGGVAKPGQVAKILQKDEKAVSYLFRKLANEGLLISTSYGVYSLLSPPNKPHEVLEVHEEGSTEKPITSRGSCTSCGILDNAGEEELEIF